jgi:hypothetical protein
MQNNQTIFVVLSRSDYECDDVLKAFSSKDDAEALSKACSDYDQTFESCPEIEDTPENDALWDAWNIRNEAWKKAHPAGEYGHVDSYPIREVEFVAANPPLAAAPEAP